MLWGGEEVISKIDKRLVDNNASLKVTSGGELTFVYQSVQLRPEIECWRSIADNVQCGHGT